MKTFGRAIIALGVAFGGVWLVFSSFEGATEVEVLCANFSPGTSLETVREVLETGEYLRYVTEASPAGDRIVVDTLFDLGATRCIIDFTAEGRVLQARLDA